MPGIYMMCGVCVCLCLYVSLQADNGDQQHTVLLSGPTLPRTIQGLLELQFCSILFKLKVLTCTNTHTHFLKHRVSVNPNRLSICSNGGWSLKNCG